MESHERDPRGVISLSNTSMCLCELSSPPSKIHVYGFQLIAIVACINNRRLHRCQKHWVRECKSSSDGQPRIIGWNRESSADHSLSLSEEQHAWARGAPQGPEGLLTNMRWSKTHIGFTLSWWGRAGPWGVTRWWSRQLLSQSLSPLPSSSYTTLPRHSFVTCCRGWLDICKWESDQSMTPSLRTAIPSTTSQCQLTCWSSQTPLSLEMSALPALPHLKRGLRLQASMLSARGLFATGAAKFCTSFLLRELLVKTTHTYGRWRDHLVWKLGTRAKVTLCWHIARVTSCADPARRSIGGRVAIWAIHVKEKPWRLWQLSILWKQKAPKFV